MTKEDNTEETPKELLSNSGRISAIQTLAEQTKDLTEQAKSLGDKAQAIEDTTIEELTKNNEILKRSNRFLMAAVTLIAVLALTREYRATFISGPKLESVQDTVEGPLSDANAKLDKIAMFIQVIKPQLCDDLAGAPKELIEYCTVEP